MEDEIVEIVSKNSKLITVGLVGLVLIISIPFMWSNYERHQQRQRTIQTCEKLKAARNEVIKKMDAGEKISSYEALGVYQIGLMTPDDCSKPLI